MNMDKAIRMDWDNLHSQDGETRYWELIETEQDLKYRICPTLFRGTGHDHKNQNFIPNFDSKSGDIDRNGM
jgi:hypothetical protein